MNYDYENQATGQKEPEGMRVLVVEPWKEPYLKTISGDLKSLQREVGGLIDATYPFEDMVAIVLNGEGKLNGMMPNRGLYNEDGELYDIIAGPFLVTGFGGEEFVSLNKELAAKYMEKYKVPEMPVCINGEMAMIPIPEEVREKTASAEKEPESGKSQGSRTCQNRKIRKRSRANEGR